MDWVMHMLQTSKNVEMDQKLCRQVVNVKNFMEPFIFPQKLIRLIHIKVHQVFGKIRAATMSSNILDAYLHQQPDNSNTGATTNPDLILHRCISSYNSINYSCWPGSDNFTSNTTTQVKDERQWVMQLSKS